MNIASRLHTQFKTDHNLARKSSIKVVTDDFGLIS